MSIQSLLDYISVTPDIRQQGKVKHKLSAILFLTVCAVIAGADEWQEIEDFGHVSWPPEIPDSRCILK